MKPENTPKSPQELIREAMPEDLPETVSRIFVPEDDQWGGNELARRAESAIRNLGTEAVRRIATGALDAYALFHDPVPEARRLARMLYDAADPRDDGKKPKVPTA